jgi:hypothetical protein
MQVDKATIVGEVLDYIKTLESTLKGLEKLLHSHLTAR